MVYPGVRCPTRFALRIIELQGQGLTPRQENFVSEYLRDLNGTRAAIRAGYSPKTAAQAASRLLRNVNISAAVRREKDLRARRLQISADIVVQRLTQIARTNIYDFLDFQPDGTFRLDFLKASPEQTAGVARVTVTKRLRGGKIISKVESLRLADRVRALELLGRHLGLFEGGGEGQQADPARDLKQLIVALGLTT